MGSAGLAHYLRKHRWLIAFVFLVFAGYTVGKDMALRENARDRIAAQVASQ